MDKSHEAEFSGEILQGFLDQQSVSHAFHSNTRTQKISSQNIEMNENYKIQDTSYCKKTHRLQIQGHPAEANIHYVLV